MTVFNKFFGKNKNNEIPSTPPLATDRRPATSPPPAAEIGEAVPDVRHRRYNIDERIGERYQIVRVLEGGMGLVYLCADQENDNRPVALKTFKPRYLADRVTRDRFLREGTIWVALGKHPHIVHAFGVDRFENGLEVYLVLEWVASAEGKENASLRAWLRAENALPLEQALLFALHIARGMKHAVAKVPGLIHRDLKPENVLVGRDSIARVTDFGLAGVVTSHNEPARYMGNRVRASDGGMGTPLYMAPEQWKRRAKVDHRADIYAFGCILYEMLIGNLAVSGADASELARAHQLGWVNPLPPNFPPQIGALVRGCLALTPAKRFQTWSDVETAVSLVYQQVTGSLPPAASSGENQTTARAERIAAGWSYNAMGLSYRDIGNHDLAAGYFERVLWVGQQERDVGLVSAGLRHLGDAYRQLGDLDGAVKYHRRQAALARKVEDRLGECDALGSLGKDYTRLGDIEQAMAHFQRQLSLVRKLGDHHREGRALSNVGDACRTMGKMDQALEVYKIALKTVRRTGDRFQEGRILGNIGLVYAAQSECTLALTCFEQALAIAKEVGDRTGEGNAFGYLGMIHHRDNNLPRALWFYINQLSIAQETRDQMTESHVLADLGDIYLEMKNTEQAIESYQFALTVARKLSDQPFAIQLLQNLGKAHFENGTLNQSIGFYEEALMINRKLGNLRQASKNARQVGDIYRMVEDFWRARERYQQALTLAQNANDRYLWAATSRDFAKLLADQGQRTRALFFAEEAVRIFNNLNEPQEVKLAKDVLSKIKRRWRWR